MLEQRPVQPVTFPPQGGARYKVRTGDSWESIARAHNLDTWALIEFNFPVVKNERNFQTKCRMVNWLLRQYVGCTKSSDGKNYRFDTGDAPGVIYIPAAAPQPVFTHRVRLHFRSLSLTNVPFDTHLRCAERVYAQYGIRIEFGSGMSMLLPDEQRRRLEVVDGQCNWNITSGEFSEVQQLAGNLPSTDILVCYVNRFQSETLRGCGGHAPNRPACIVAAAGSQWTTAHEVGHVLLTSSFSPVHESNTSNLMYSSTTAITAALPSLSDAQVAQMKRSPCCVRV